MSLSLSHLCKYTCVHYYNYLYDRLYIYITHSLSIFPHAELWHLLTFPVCKISMQSQWPVYTIHFIVYIVMLVFISCFCVCVFFLVEEHPILETQHSLVVLFHSPSSGPRMKDIIVTILAWCAKPGWCFFAKKTRCDAICLRCGVLMCFSFQWKHVGKRFTPRKINMEHDNTSLEKTNHQNHHFLRGCSQYSQWSLNHYFSCTKVLSARLNYQSRCQFVFFGVNYMFCIYHLVCVLTIFS